MPRRPKTICRAPACGALIDAPGFCARHQVQQHRKDAERRGTAAERGYGSKWQAARDAFLRLHPLCTYCEKKGRVEAAKVVDHIAPHRLKEAIDSGNAERIAKAQHLFWSGSNWQSLCGPCHDSVKQKEEAAARRL